MAFHAATQSFALAETWKCDICRKKCFSTYEACEAHEKVCGGLMAIVVDEEDASEVLKTASNSQKLHPFFTTPKTRKQTVPQESGKSTRNRHVLKNSSNEKACLIDMTDCTPKKSLKVKPRRKTVSKATNCLQQKLSNRSLTPSGPNDSKYSSELLAMAATLGMDPKTLWEQQKAVERQAQVKVAEKSVMTKKRQIVKSKVHPVQAVKAVPYDSSRRRKCAASRFPESNHVAVESFTIEESRSLSLNEIRIKEKKRPWKRVKATCSPFPDEVFSPLLETGRHALSKTSPAARDEMIVNLLSSNLQSSPVENITTLLVDLCRICNIDEICGNRHQISEIESHVREWKLARKKSLDHMEAKRRPKKLKKTNARYMYNEDDWMGSDTEEDFGLPSLFTVTGPTGCGKTEVVRAIVEANDCKLIELNTSEARGASALKKAIGEATQSLSSSELIHKARGHLSFESRPPSSEGDSPNGSSLTVILVDEVDITFEDEGDAGFWQALVDISRKAKCPIFLTSNQPIQVPCYSKSVSLQKPSPEECIPRLRSIIGRAKSLSFCYTDDSSQNEFLRKLAILCDCDLRKAAHELHLHAVQAHSAQNEPNAEKTFEQSDSPRDANTQPRLYCAMPSSINGTEYSLVSIKGERFTSLIDSRSEFNKLQGYPVEVFFGEQKCPCSLILSDTDIITVCAPFLTGNPRRMTRSYMPIRIQASSKLGIVSTSFGTVARVWNEDTEIVACTKPVYIEVSEELRHHHANSAESDETEMEFEFEDHTAGKTKQSDRPEQRPEIDMKKAMLLLEEGVSAWLSRHHQIDANPKSFRKSTVSVNELEQQWKETSLASDAALLEGVGLHGVPFLTGPVRGFGFDLTEAFPMYRNEKNKRPTEQILFESSWKDDCFFFGGADTYFTNPLANPLDKKLLAYEGSFAQAESFEGPILDGDEDGTLYDVDDIVEMSPLANRPIGDIVSLPAILRGATSCTELGGASSISLECRRAEALIEKCDLFETLKDTVFAKTCWSPLLFFGNIHRVLHPSVCVDYMDQRLCIDYLPALRCISFYDWSAKQAHHKLKERTESTGESRRGRTRSSTRLGFEGFWKRKIPAETWKRNCISKCDNPDDLTSKLSDLVLFSKMNKLSQNKRAVQ